MRAVHFGAGNIGRGFIGAVLQDAGYFVTFADVNQELIEKMRSSDGYSLIELDETEKRTHYKNFEILNSTADEVALITAIGEADVITASVGTNVLPFIAPAIARGINARPNGVPLVIMACENAINATDILSEKILQSLDKIPNNIFFANTAVDRIVPMQPADTEPDVVAESFCEWVIDTSGLGGIDLKIPAATMVKDLQPFIERKLYTVNTAHLTIAYLGQLNGHSRIAASLTDPIVRDVVARVMEETSMVLVTKHGFDANEHAKYVRKTLLRLANPALDDQVERVGRQPLRKLSRFERLIGPAALLTELNESPVALLEVVEAALAFTNHNDSEVELLEAKLGSLSPAEFASEVCGISHDHRLADALEQAIAKHQGTLSHK
jgi:mannitol-1-phosphate 5-dehydrogenase